MFASFWPRPAFPPFGYDIKERKLIINSEEAKIVRFIFEHFVHTGSNIEIVRKLRDAKITTKSWVMQSGALHKGREIDTLYIHRILRNRVYLGEAVYKGQSYPGEHKPIVDNVLWEDAQRIMKDNPKSRANMNRSRTPFLLRGLVQCGCCGSAMTPSASTVRPKGFSYRYYVCTRAIREGREACQIRSIPAAELEAAVMLEIKAAFSAPELVAAIGRHLEVRDASMAALGALRREQLVREKLQNFEDLWTHLFVREQQKLLAELIDHIEVRMDGVRLHLKKNGLTKWIAGEQHGNRDDHHSSIP